MKRLLIFCAASLLVAIPATLYLVRDQNEVGPVDPIEALIDQLASTNAPANPSKDWGTMSPPPSYDMAAQEKVEAAREELKKQDYRRLIPALIKHRKDERYCRSEPVAILNDYSVGDTCMQLLDSIVDPPIKARSGYKGMPDYSFVIGADPEGWWAQRAHMSLEDIQLQALRWTIEEEKKQWDNLQGSILVDGTTREQWMASHVAPLERELLARLKRE
jgi:hypothetical protein